WYQEIRAHSEAPIILCGCQSDIRDDVKHPVTYEQAMTISRKMNATGYIETSAKVEEGVTDAFELSALAALGKSRFASLVRRHAPHLKKHLRTHHQHRSCSIM
ncbi:rho-related GTP-binding protein RhoE, partial [Caerostris extrusa]